MKRNLFHYGSHYALFILAASVLCVGCSKSPNGMMAVPALTSSQTQTDQSPGEQTSLVATITYPPAMAQSIQSQSQINLGSSCAQWTRHNAGNTTAEVVEFHRGACPSDGSTLRDDSLAFSADVERITDEGEDVTYQLVRNDTGTQVVVGQVIMSATGVATLQELCQFTASGQATSEFNNNCYVVEEEGSYGSLDITQGN